MDYSKLSDSTLMALKNNQPIDYSKLSDEELKVLASDTPPAPKEDPSLTKTVLDQATNGVALGWKAKADGALEALGQAIGVDNLGGAFKDMHADSSGPTINWDKIKQAYETRNAQTRGDLKTEETDHPVVSTAANIGGMIANPIAATTSIPALAGVGAISALGESQADNVKDLAKDTAIGGAVAGTLGAAGKYVAAPVLSKAGEKLAPIGEAISNKTANVTDYLLKKMGKVVASVPEDVTERYLANRNVINNAKPIEAIGEDLLDKGGQHVMDDGGGIQQLKSKIASLDNNAWKTLDTTPSIPKQAVIDQGNQMIEDILKGPMGTLTRENGTGASRDMINAIQTQLSEITDAYGDKLSESDLKSVIQDLQKLAYSYEGAPKYTIAADGLNRLSGKLNNVLKTNNPAYAEAMLPVADATKTLSSVEKNFVNKQDPDTIDKFLQKTNRFQRANDQSSMKQSLAGLDELTGNNYGQQIQSTKDLDSFYKTDTNGSRKTILGALAGKAVTGGLGAALGYHEGGAGGAAFGAVAGFGADKYAGMIFKKVLDGRIAGPEAIASISSHLGPYARPLMDAAKRGPAALAATHFLLSQQDSNYRAKMDQLDKDQGQ